MNFNYPIFKSHVYLNANPFPHIILKDKWDKNFLKKIEKEIEIFSDWDGEKDFYGSRKKYWNSDIERLPMSAENLIRETGSPRFIKWLEDLTGEKSLIPDPYLEGGGIHCIKKSGFLKMHADFNWHGKLRLYR